MPHSIEKLDDLLAAHGHFYLSKIVAKARVARQIDENITRAQAQSLLAQLEQASCLDAAIMILQTGCAAQIQRANLEKLTEREWQQLRAEIVTLPRTNTKHTADLIALESENAVVNTASSNTGIAYLAKIGFIEEWITSQPNLSVQVQLEQKLIVQQSTLLTEKSQAKVLKMPQSSPILTLRKNYFHQQGGALTLQINRAQQRIEINQYIAPTAKPTTLTPQMVNELEILTTHLQTSRPMLVVNQKLIAAIKARIFTGEQCEKAQDIAASALLLNKPAVRLQGPLENELQAAWVFIEAQINCLSAVADNTPCARMVGAEYYGFDPYLLNTVARAIYQLRQQAKPALDQVEQAIMTPSSLAATQSVLH